MEFNFIQLKNMQEIVHKLTFSLQNLVAESIKENRAINIAFPGGTTPIPFFEYLTRAEFNSVWPHIHVFWGDERCVPPEHPESNYGQAEQVLFSKIPISRKNIHRIRGENDPKSEVKRYTNDIQNFVPINKSGWPEFDWIILGMGIDGHTASIFQNSTEINDNSSISLITHHPRTGQKRISLGFGVINQAKKVTFIVTGESKARIVSQILNEEPDALDLPAAKVQPMNGILEWYLDSELIEFK